MSGSNRHTIGRRDVLRGALVASAAGLASQLGIESLARAAAAKRTQRRFIFAYFPGGWDQLLFLDPRDPDTDAKEVRRFEPEHNAHRNALRKPRGA